ncbi:MAG: SDR family oxidoreductase [Oscillospiraceae bacterium]|nr:SDR family oxidoreductase [Oscillospiraceae bacterium]
MKALIIGGTGTISSAVTELLIEKDWEVYVLNRGTGRKTLPEKVKQITVNIDDEAAVSEKLAGLHFDSVCEFIGFVPAQLERDYRLFKGKTEQYIFISSASAYHKPARSHVITEGTTLANPHWEYSRNKIACEEYLMKLYREEGFPVTIVRPSHTYDERNIPVGAHGKNGSWQVIKRIMEGKPVIVQGDGSSLWTLTHNTDFAVGFAGLMGNPHAIGEAFHITSDESLTWNQIYETIAGALGVQLKAYHVASDLLAEVGKQYDFEGGLLGDKSVTVVFDNSKLKRIVPEYNAVVSFKEGVRKALDYILAHPECQVEDEEFDEWCDKLIAALEKAKKELM